MIGHSFLLVIHVPDLPALCLLHNSLSLPYLADCLYVPLKRGLGIGLLGHHLVFHDISYVSNEPNISHFGGLLIINDPGPEGRICAMDADIVILPDPRADL